MEQKPVRKYNTQQVSTGTAQPVEDALTVEVMLSIYVNGRPTSHHHTTGR